MIDRAALVAVFLAVLLAEDACAQARIYRVGYLTLQAPQPERDGALRLGLRESGFIEGENLVIEYRSAAGKPEHVVPLAAELVRVMVDVIVATTNRVIAVARLVTETIPIVMVVPTDPLALGFIRSLARPGGNITGLATNTEYLTGKRVELLKEAVPGLSRLAVIWDPTEPGRERSAKETEAAARDLGLQVRVLPVRNPGELDAPFAAAADAGAVNIVVSAMLYANGARTAKLAAARGLATVCATPEEVQAGCLMSYAPDYAALYRRAGQFAGRILKGAKAGELPIEQPTKFELVLNLKTAKSLGIVIPPSMLLRAGRVIE